MANMAQNEDKTADKKICKAEDKGDKIRQHIIFSGAVQGVGFRYRAYYAARTLNLTGWVKNKWDGTVEMEVQGSQKEICKMITMINQGNYVNIEDIKMKNMSLDVQERDFRIRG